MKKGHNPLIVIVYTLKIDLDIERFRIQEDEVSAIKWISLPELQKQLSRSPEKYLPTMKKYLGLLIK